MSSHLPPWSMHNSRWIYWGTPSSPDSKNDANVGSIVKDPPSSRLVVTLHLFALPLPPVLLSTPHLPACPPLHLLLLSCLNLVHPGQLLCCLPSTCDSATTTHRLSRPWLVVASSARSILSHQCGLSSHCAVASRSPFLAPLVWLVVALPLQMLPPPFCWHLRLLSRRRLSLRHGLPYLLSGWLLHCLYSRRRLPSAGISASHRAMASCRAMASRTS